MHEAMKKKNKKRGLRRRVAGVGFRRDESGVAAIEFAIVSPVFLVMMFSLFEIGWFYYVNSVVDASVADGARLIETGQIQKMSSLTDQEKEDFIYDTVCDVLRHFGDCNTHLTVEVETFPTFAALAAATEAATCANAPPDQLNAIPFDPGNQLAIVRVRICLLYKPVNPAIGIDLTEPGSSARRLVSQSVFRNEPYEVNNGS